MTQTDTQTNTPFPTSKPSVRPPWTMPHAAWEVYSAAWDHARVHETARGVQYRHDKAEAALAEYRAAVAAGAAS